MRRTPVNCSGRRAFTLLELLLVLMLIGISAATIVPHLNGTLGRWQLRETARNLETTLQAASQWARVRQESIVFALDAKRGTFGLRVPPGVSSSGGGLLSVGRQSFGQGVEIVRMGGFTDQGAEKILAFRPDGTAPAAEIVLAGSRPDANRETLWQIAVDDHGTIRCEEKSVDEEGE